MNHLSTDLLLALAKSMRSHTALCWLMLAACLVAPLNTAYAQSNIEAKVTLSSTEDPGDPFWATAPSKNIAYGIEVKTIGDTDDSPWVTIHGTKGSSKRFLLDNEPDNFGAGRTEYFLYAAAEVRNVGIPTAIEFEAGGDDGWSFENVIIDIFAGQGWEFSSRTWYGRNGANDRTKAITSGAPWDYQKVLIDRIVFDGHGAIDGDGDFDGSVRMEKKQTLYPVGAKLGVGGTTVVPVSSQIIIVDARHSPVPIQWNSSKETSISGGEVMKALKRHEKEAGMSNTFTVTAKETLEASGGGMTSTGEFTVSNSLTVSASMKKATQDEKTRQVDQAFSSSDGQVYTIDPGMVAFFDLTISASVERYTDFSKLRRISPSVTPSYSLQPRYYLTECATGELRGINVYSGSTSGDVIDIGKNNKFVLGDKLKDPSQKMYFDAAKKAWPTFFTHMDLPEGKCGGTVEELAFEYTRDFEKVWDDAGSGADSDVGFFQPIPPQGYYVLGHYAHASHEAPTTSVLVVKEEKAGALAEPIGYERIWTDAGSGADQDGAVWQPSCPGNFVAIGLVTTSGAEPSSDAVRCVRKDLTVQAEVGELIWNDSGSGADADFAAWRVQAPDSEGEIFVPATFIGHASHSDITNANARALKKSKK